jgi:hypothetical protein
MNNLKMIGLVYLLKKRDKIYFDFLFFLFSTWHCRVAIQFDYCFLITGLEMLIWNKEEKFSSKQDKN